MLASFFPKLDKIIISDCDVVFLRDISKSFLEISCDDDFYIAGVKEHDPNWIFTTSKTDPRYRYRKFNKDELEALHTINVGYFIANLKKWREDDIQSRLVSFGLQNASRLVLPEQDCLNIICYPKIKILHPAYNVFHNFYEKFGEKWENLSSVYPQNEVNEARDNPIMIHYAGMLKPWNTPSIMKGEFWLKYLCKTAFLDVYLQNIESTIITRYIEGTFSARAKRYAKNNPLFIIDPRFYVKLARKIARGFK